VELLWDRTSEGTNSGIWDWVRGLGGRAWGRSLCPGLDAAREWEWVYDVGTLTIPCWKVWTAERGQLLVLTRWGVLGHFCGLGDVLVLVCVWTSVMGWVVLFSAPPHHSHKAALSRCRSSALLCPPSRTVQPLCGQAPG
jgi:hypothetical protein